MNVWINLPKTKETKVIYIYNKIKSVFWIQNNLLNFHIRQIQTTNQEMLNNKLEIVLAHGKMRTLKHFNLYKVGLHLRNVLLACLGPSAFISHTSTQCRGGAEGVEGAVVPLTPPKKVLHIFIKLSCTLKVRI